MWFCCKSGRVRGNGAEFYQDLLDQMLYSVNAAVLSAGRSQTLRLCRCPNAAES